MDLNKINCGDELEVLKTFPDESINSCITSPPYYGLRDYGVCGQIGLEETVEKYIERLADVFDEVKRVLRDDGTLWLNIGDSYAGSGKGWQGKNAVSLSASKTKPYKTGNIKAKDMIGVPWMLAFELRRRGWYLRQDIIWAKPNPMPESVKDRCTKSHEYIFLLSKSHNYYFDGEAIAEPIAESSIKRYEQDIERQKGSAAYGKTNGNMKAVAPRYGGKKYTETPEEFFRTKSGSAYQFRPKRNKRDVWVVSTKPYKGAHFATFPGDLIMPCLLAGCPENGVVLDPFFGSGTLGVVCKQRNRNFVGIELNPKYIELANERLESVQMEFNF